ncbi:MAG: hypothetical protein NTY08_18835 [Proteobacteria bacterium]|nr:hypothetical protein [Pseudomonadota bacterium]
MNATFHIRNYKFLCLALGLSTVACKPHYRAGRSDGVGEAPAVNNDVPASPKSKHPGLDWYLQHTAGERSALPIGGTVPPPPTPTNFAKPQLPSVCVVDSEGSIERIQPLFCVPVPRPTATDIVDQQAAIRLGKALFWDIQVGGDGNTSCASCHFVGGGDNRVINTIHPGVDGVFASGGVTGPGQVFTSSDITNDDRVGSQGVVGSVFTSISTDSASARDNCTPDQSAPFLTHRRVTGRNTPSVIGAVYNLFNFWDGRASPIFNGYDPFGNTGNASVSQVLFDNGSLASQAVGPPNNSVEMSCGGRPFNGPGSLGAKLLSRQALQFQQVAFSDSSLGVLSAWPNKGLKCFGRACNYSDLVSAAFGAKWTSLSQNHFSRLWGEALQAYMSVLVPDQTRMDQYLAGKQKLLSAQQVRGLDIFKGRGNCTRCHSGPELTDASVNYGRLDRREDQGNDEGFHNLGLGPTAEDLGRGSVGPGNVPLSVSRSEFDQGAFKTPGLRNLKLTAPYFHNGGKATLESVVSFYAHNGGDAPNPELSRELEEINLAVADFGPLVDLLNDGLLDCRVEKQRAPFDHPSLPLPNGTNLPELGMTGLGSCRLDAATPPTTLNCLNSPFLCETDDALVGTSIYLDLTGQLPVSNADLVAFQGASPTLMLPKITAILNSGSYLDREKNRLLEAYLRRSPTATDIAAYVKPTLRDTVIAVMISATYQQSTGSSAQDLATLITADLAGRQPTAAEITLLKSDKASLIGNLYDSVDGRKKRAVDLYRRILRRESTAAELTTWANANNERNSLVALIAGPEYRKFAIARDDI